MLTARTLITRANYIVGGEGFTQLGLDGLNAVLGDLCEDYDFALARGLFAFNFNPGLASLFGSGPYNLPLDYLRTSGSSGAEGVTRSAWFLYPAPAYPQGQPMELVPIDLGRFDQYPQVAAQGIPSTIATDMGGPLTQRITAVTTVALTAASTSGTVASASGISNGLSVAGEGITPGTTVTIAGTTLTLSQPATKTIAAASVFFGIAPVCYVYPPPVGAYPVTIRYQRKMPPIADLDQIPWFPNEGYLIEKLVAFQMALSGDERRAEYELTAGHKLARYLDLADDKTNRAQRVQLDPSAYGRGTGYARLKNTKVAGW